MPESKKDRIHLLMSWRHSVKQSRGWGVHDERLYDYLTSLIQGADIQTSPPHEGKEE